MMDLVDQVVQNWVIASDDPRDPAASRNGVKMRALVAALAPSLVVLWTLAVLQAPQLAQVLVPIALLLVSVKAVAGPINDACEEWDAREDSDPHPEAGGDSR